MLKYLDAQPLFDELATTEIFPLRNDELGQTAVRIMNERFKGNRHVELDISHLGIYQPIGQTNLVRRFLLGRIVNQLSPDIQIVSPAVWQIASRYYKVIDDDCHYQDLGLVVYSLEGSNSRLACHLLEQAKSNGVNILLPMMFYNLKVVSDDNMSNGVRFDYDEKSFAYHVPILTEKPALTYVTEGVEGSSNFDDEDTELIKSGFPSKLGIGSRVLYHEKYGLRRVYCHLGLHIDTRTDDLTKPIAKGRFHFIKGEIPRNLDEILATMDKRRAVLIESFAQSLFALMRDVGTLS